MTCTNCGRGRGVWKPFCSFYFIVFGVFGREIFLKVGGSLALKFSSLFVFNEHARFILKSLNSKLIKIIPMRSENFWLPDRFFLILGHAI